MPKNRMGKSRTTDDPYLTFQSADGAWTWRVLKSWQGNDSKPYARWFCDVSSPATFGGSDLGDTYVSDVVSHAYLVAWDRETFGDEPELTVPVRRGWARCSHGYGPGDCPERDCWAREPRRSLR